jgi:DNA-binding transcriptional LysR family regulator
MPFDLVWLRSFLEVAERGSVAAAAAALGYTAPAVSQHIGKLERGLGTLLFDRVGSRLRLAPAGEALVPVARQLLELALLVPETVRAPKSHPDVAVAGFASAIGALVTPNLARLTELASIHVIEAEDTEALRELRLGHIDIALIQEYSGDACNRDPRLHYAEVARDHLRLVLPPSYPDDATIHDLGDLPWLINGMATKCAAATHKILQDNGLDVRVSGAVSDNRALLSLVAAGHGATIVPDLILDDSAGDITITAQALGVERTILAVTREFPTAAARGVVEAIVYASPSRADELLRA